MKTAKIQSPLLLVALALFLFSSCANLQKQIDAGNYDKVIAISVKKLRGKTKKKQKHVDALETAFNRANDRDVRRMEALKAKGDVKSIEKIIFISEGIAERQELLEPLLPVIDKEGYQAEFRFVKVGGIIRESEERVVKMLYDEGLDFMADAKAGDKYAARKAYASFNRIDRYMSNYREVNTLKNKAHELGTTHIRFRVDNDAPVVLPRRFMEEVKGFGAGELNSFWNVFYTESPADVNMDYEVVMKVKDVDVLPESIKEVEYVDRREIEDGWEYVLDENGNVMKDTLGNDIKIPRYRFVEAFVFETFQYKEVRVDAQLEFVDLRQQNVMGRSRLGTVAVFENYASTFRGDRRALSNKSKLNLGNRPLPFPQTEQMLIDAASSLKPEIKSRIHAQKLI